ncbi:hypothetical protein CDD80_3468 [Ophiocordyceps camponoti-rufipedis]|uniref:FYVE-type domain-containing protein n=1 Tax=Ophiocordyceps camponoti-rufipedis TaxID=2004952 RepID=A0A2C5Z3J5_9HYPO|nr:hypothetical protein CDD80_3468 [Ophiocordyceps camponoti-rufipedis]
MAADLVMPAPRSQDAQSWHFLPGRPPSRRSPSFRAATGPHMSPHSISDAGSNQTDSSYPPSPTGVLTTSKGRPVYIPAVLRPCDEFPSKKIFTSAGSVSDSDSDSPLRRVNSNIINLALGHRLTRRPSTDSAKAFNGHWNLDSYPQVTDLPTRIHWKPDPQSSVCDDPTCKRGFSYFVRRHHCRKCGNIFCDWHSSFLLPLDQDANFNPRATPSRACAHCFQETKASQALPAPQPTTTSLPANTPPHAIATASPTLMMARPTGSTLATTCASDAAASVPRDWNWSTF